MRSGNVVRRLIVSLRFTLLSRLLVGYLAIMLLVLVTQGLLLGQIYQEQYYNERVAKLNQEASALALEITRATEPFASIPIKDIRGQAYVVAKRLNAVVWIVTKPDKIYQIKQDASATTGGSDIVPDAKEVNDLQSEPDFERFQRFLNGVLRGKTFDTDKSFFASRFDAEVLTVGVPILYEGLPIGAVLLHTKMEVMNRAIGTMYQQIAISAAIALGLGAVLISVMSTRISKPLVQMNSIAGHIARGNFDRKADVNSKDEIGQLARSFNTMAEELKKQEDLRAGFVANVSHELRSPLTSIHGFAQGMLDGTIPAEDSQKYLEVIVGETRRLNKLIRELLDLSQIESGKFPLNMQVFDINGLISRVLITFEEKINAKSLEIEVDFRQDRAHVYADPDRIEQVVINLLDNAVKFTDACGRIRIWTHGASDKMLVGISDTGPGIPEEDQPYVWERFYKVDKAHTGRKGTGLGLSIVKKIIDQHGERITLQSQKGYGAVFVFSLKKPD